MHDPDAFPPTEDSIDRLGRSGWSSGETTAACGMLAEHPRP
jgi:hypothetical protein